MTDNQFYRLKSTSYSEYTTNDELVVFVSISKKTYLLPAYFKIFLDSLKKAFPDPLSFSDIENAILEQVDIESEQVSDDLDTLIRIELITLLK